MWHDDIKAKQGKPGIERLVGWSHPELRNLLRYPGIHLFIDGTFRCAPKQFYQFITLMMYDPLTDLFVPIMFTLATNKTNDAYVKMLQCIEFAVQKKPDPVDVVCDFKAALIFAVRGHFPSTRIIGCLFHFKQACRRKMKEYRLPDVEVQVAMTFGVLDMLTVVRPDKIAKQGVAWVKAKIRDRCTSTGISYSHKKWKQFWVYFAKTWLETFPPELWNIFGVQRKIVNRTNNPLERFHRELNARMKPHPSLKRFVRVIEEIAREYVVLRRSIISGDATAPTRTAMRSPRAAVLPDLDAIEASDSDGSSDDANDNVGEEEDTQLSDDELGLLYDTSFDYEEEEKTELELTCTIVGEGRAFDVKVDDGWKATKLQEAIQKKNKNDLGKVAGAASVALGGDETLQGFEMMDPTLFIKNPKYFGANFQPGEGKVHVLVVVLKSPAGGVTAAATPMTEEIPGAKRRRTEAAVDSTASLNCGLVPIIEIAQQLNPETRLTVGSWLDIPLTNLGRFDTGLFVRKEYWDLHKTITQRLESNDEIYRVLVVAPGSETGMGRSMKSRAPVAGKRYEGLFDGDDTGGALDSFLFLHSYVFANPRTTNCNHFVKEGRFKVCMNPWTKTECQQLADALHLDDEVQDEWLRGYNLVVGNPNFLFSTVETLDSLVKRVKGDVPHDIEDLKRMIHLFKQEVLDFNSLFHFYRRDDNPSSSYLAYSSLAVEAIVSERYDICSADEIHSLLQTPTTLLRTPESTLQAWRGKEMEKFLLQDLATRKFCVKALEGNVGAVVQLGEFNARSRIIQAVSDIKNELVLYVPLSKIFPAIDAVLVIPSEEDARTKKTSKGQIIYVQSTVAESHPIKYQRLKNVYQDLEKRQEFRGFTHMLLFIVPDDTYDEFPAQPYKNDDNKSCNTEINIDVTQFVGKITPQ